MTQAPPSPRWLTEATILATLSVAGYAVALAYQAGFCAHFNIPHALIRLDLLGVLVALATIGLSVIVTLLFAKISFDLSGSGHHPILQAVAYSAIFSSFLVSLFVLGGWNAPNVPLFAAFAAGAITRQWLHPLTERRVTGYVNKLRALHKRDGEDPTNSIAFLNRRISPAHLAFVLAWLLELSYLAGWTTARSTEDFLVPVEKPSILVVRFYGDTAVAVSWDAKSRRIGDRIELLPVSEARAFQKKHIGKLLPTE